MITGEISFQIWAQDNNSFRMITKKFRQKWLVKKSKFVWRKKKPTPSTNIPLLSNQKSEQQDCLYIREKPECSDCPFMWSRIVRNFEENYYDQLWLASIQFGTIMSADNPPRIKILRIETIIITPAAIPSAF